MTRASLREYATIRLLRRAPRAPTRRSRAGRPYVYGPAVATAADVLTSWVELEAVWGKGQQRVGTAIHHVRTRLPMPLRGLDSDNGSEFINQDLYRCASARASASPAAAPTRIVPAQRE